MTAISDPQAIKFSNEQLRPICEEVRALMARITAMNTTWFGGINNLFPNDASPLADNRDAEGASRLTGADVNSAMNIIGNIIAQNNATIIGKPCVRALSAS